MPRKLLFAGALVITGMTVAPFPAPDRQEKEASAGTARAGNGPLTRTGDNIVVLYDGTDKMHSAPETRIETANLGPANPDLPRAIARLGYLRGFGDGWKGPDSTAVTLEAFVDANSLLEKIAAEAQVRPLPKIGLDSDGVVVMSWGGPDLHGSLSVFGDGTYSYFLRGRGDPAKNGEVRISDPLPADLRRVLMA